MPRTPEETSAKLESLPTGKLLDVIASLAKGDLEAAKKGGGGGVSRAELGALLPDGETGGLLDGLERRAAFLLVRQVGLSILRALPGAITTLAALTEGVGPGDAEPMCEENDKQAQALRTARVTMLPKLLEQRRLGALALFDLAKELELFTLAKLYRAPDIEADEEQELQRMAAAQGLDYLPPLSTRENVKHRVP